MQGCELGAARISKVAESHIQAAATEEAMARSCGDELVARPDRVGSCGKDLR